MEKQPGQTGHLSAKLAKLKYIRNSKEINLSFYQLEKDRSFVLEIVKK